MSNGSDMWGRAKSVIPGGSHLLSKRAEMFLPEGWPTYFDHAKGCTVWDLDGNAYADVGFMGIGTNILGYGHPAVDEAVRAVIDKGNLSTLLAPEEVLLAERLIELHPWADMARFTRAGGEAGAVAVRIARAASGKDKVALCGYHGWHDWYLAANLGESSALDGHLLPGLAPKGVPRALSGSAIPFAYNDLASLERVLGQGDVGVIYMEVERSTPPAPGFLEGCRALATKHGAVLVFDECTSGFRRNLGGVHLYHGVDPDVAVFGKTLGNGYAINAIIGRASIMQAAQETFISSTFWTERIGPSAALAALSVMKDEDAPARISAIGEHVRAQWAAIGSAVGLGVVVAGIPSLSTYSIEGFKPLEAKTFITQEMLRRGFLSPPVLYASIAHTSGVLDGYFDALAAVFSQLSALGPEGVLRALPEGVCQSGFQRLA